MVAPFLLQEEGTHNMTEDDTRRDEEEMNEDNDAREEDIVADEDSDTRDIEDTARENADKNEARFSNID